MGWYGGGAYCRKTEGSCMKKHLFLTMISALILSAMTDTTVLAQQDRSKIKEELEKDNSSGDPDDVLFPEKSNNILETVVDPKQYYVGPGDQFLVSIWGQVNQNFRTVVSPEGFLIVPTVKAIDVKNLNLADVQERVGKSIRTVYTNAEVTINLVSLRSFRVPVGGMCNNPSSVVVSGTERVSTAIAKAGGLNGKASQRNIILYRKDGTSQSVDFIKRGRNLDLDSDPLLNDGDRIFVPAQYASYQILGAVASHGTMEYVANENIIDAIRLAGGLVQGIDSSIFIMYRMAKDTGREVIRITRDLREAYQNPEDTTINLRLKPDDRIYFRKHAQYHDRADVAIQGEVMYPGSYAIIEDKTTVSDVIKRAGGFTPYVSLDRISIYRSPAKEDIDQEYERLKLTPVSEMNDIEKSYFKTKTRQQKPVVQTDFKKLFADGKVNSEYDVVLKRGDYIDVSSIRRTVTVVGGALLSGIVDFDHGKDYRYYIDKCGGFTDRAKKGDIKVIKTASQKWLDADDDVLIEDGDVIFVPEKEPVDGWQIFKDALTITGQLAAITSTIILIYFTVK